MSTIATGDHPLTDVVETEGVRSDLWLLMERLDARVGDLAMPAHWISDDEEQEGTLCGTCAEDRYVQLAARRTDDGMYDGMQECYVNEAGTENGQSTCSTCHVTLEYQYCDATCGQEMDHFRTEGSANTAFCRSDGYSIARLAEYAAGADVGVLDLMREIRDLAEAYVRLPDEAKAELAKEDA